MKFGIEIMDESYIPNIDFQLRNRHKNRLFRGDKAHWCDYCDGALVQDGTKCLRCGKRDSKLRREKK